MTSHRSQLFEEKNRTIQGELPPYSEMVNMSGSAKVTSKRWIVVVVAAVVLVGMVTGAALFGVYMQNKHVRNLVEEVIVHTKEGNERIRVDPENAEEEYDLPDKQFRVLQNFNKGISVLRLSLGKKMACYLKPLNKTAMVTPEALASILKKGGRLNAPTSDGVSDSEPYELVASENEVKDTSFLSDRARSMCRGLPVYWLFQGERNAKKASSKGGHRQKRECGFGYICRTRCIGIYNRILETLRIICFRVCGFGYGCE